MASPLRISQAKVPVSKRGPGRAGHIVHDAFDRNKRKDKLFHDEDEATAYRLKLEQQALAIKRAAGKAATIDEVGREMLTNLTGVNKEATLKHKRRYFNRVVDYFGGREIASITPDELKAFLADLRAKDGPHPRKTLESTSAWSFIHAIFLYAMDCERIFHNPMDDVAVSKRTGRTKAVALVMPSAEQVRIMLTLPRRALRAALTVSLLVGTRVGETLALDREDYVPEDGSFMVWKQRAGDTLKTPPSFRYAPIIEMAADTLGITGNEDTFALSSGPLLVDEKGERWTYKRLRREFYDFQVEMGWARRENKKISGHITIHQLRHAFVALALWSGAPIAAIAAALGHKTTTTTELVYAYLIAEKEKDLATWGVITPTTP